MLKSALEKAVEKAFIRGYQIMQGVIWGEGYFPETSKEALPDWYIPYYIT